MKNQSDLNIKYYNNNAENFAKQTQSVNMESIYQPFLAHIPAQGLILDLGCGSGRDSLNFLNKGYQVEAMDYSQALVKKASALTGLDVRHQSFYDLNESNKYDGIWACASLLHCDRSRLSEVITNIAQALKAQGICYMSFKYGTQDREKDGRMFTDLNELQAECLLSQVADTKLVKQWVTIDQRPDRIEQWLNILWKKK